MSARRSFRLKTRVPQKPSSAGRNVRDAAMVISTVKDAAMATPFKNESCRTSMPSKAMQTVEPAKSTARPEVLMAVTTASSGAQAAFQALSSSRHDEEGVVDTDAQTDERTQNGRKGGDGEPVTEECRHGGRRADGDESDQQRQEHREQRSEGEHQDDGGQDQTEDHVGAALLRGELLERVAGELHVER